MPILTRWFLKSSLVYLVLAVFLALFIAAETPLNLSIPLSGLHPMYFHLFVVGWVTQLIFGLVYWMFPKYSKDNPRFSVTLGWATFWLLNVGLFLRLVGEPANTTYPGQEWGWVLVISAVLQWLAGIAFVVNTWGRVKER